MAEAITGTEKLGSSKRMTVSKRSLIILVLVFTIPVIWFSVFRSTASPTVACDEQYDGLVKQAKAELINGDRTAAINSLMAARSKLRDCQTPTAKDVAPMFRN
jgi:hypothetical protein